jgi:Na+-driven multidrug efflux pump
MGVAPVISYNFGANNYYGLKKIYKICISFIFVGSLFIFALSFINGNSLVRLFTGTNEAVYKIAINGFMIFVFRASIYFHLQFLLHYLTVSYLL